jgi:hypothetical protein
MVRWRRRMSEDVIVEPMSRVSHAILYSVQNTLHSITILDLLVSRGGRRRILLAQLLSNGRLPLLNKLLKLKNLLMKSLQFHQLNLKLLFRVLEVAVGALPDRRWVVGSGLVTCWCTVLLAEGDGQTPYVGSVSNIGDSDRGGLLEGHPEGRLVSEGHVVEGLYVEAHWLAERELLRANALKSPVSWDGGLVVDEEWSNTVALGILVEGLAIELDAGRAADFFWFLYIKS